MASTPVLIIVGPTASGKSSLAMAMAERLDGEIISADAMAVYRGMDIGTAKSSIAERERIPHHCVDCIEPEERCDVSRWLEMAEAAIADIHARGRLPIVAGGSPLYTKSLLEGLSAGPPRDTTLRERLQATYDEQGGEAMLAKLHKVDPEYAAQRHANDRRRIVRALEVFQLTGKPYSSFHVTDGKRRDDLRTMLIGLRWVKEILHRRINARAKAMFKEGLIAEVSGIRDRLSTEACQAVGYKEVIGFLDGSYDQEYALYQVQRNSRLLAKQQLNWYKRWRDINWLEGDREDLVDAAVQLAAPFFDRAGDVATS